jgi:hypothetical protein
VAIEPTGTTVSGTLNLDSGRYVLSAKLILSRPEGSLPPGFAVLCVLADNAANIIDDATVTAAAGESRAVALASTADVSGSASFSVTCIPGGDDATATSIQLIAIRVDSVQIVLP